MEIGPGAGGSKVLDGTSLTPNHTDFVPKDANGKRWNTWFADYHFDQVWTHINKLDGIDGTFTDNFFWKPAVNGRLESRWEERQPER